MQFFVDPVALLIVLFVVGVDLVVANVPLDVRVHVERSLNRLLVQPPDRGALALARQGHQVVLYLAAVPE